MSGPDNVCRTCARPITFETRTEPGYNPREGWYDDARTDPLICFKAIDYRHIPLEGRERAIYDAGYRAGADTADEPTALAGYMVAPDGRGEKAIWRTDNELFPGIAVTQHDFRRDPALWDVLVAAVERGQA